MTQPDIFDVTRNRHGGADTSAAAFATTTTESRARMRGLVVYAIGAHGNATCDQVEATTGMSHQTASARITELVAEGKIRDTGERRKTRSGRTARVYRVTGP